VIVLAVPAFGQNSTGSAPPAQSAVEALKAASEAPVPPPPQSRQVTDDVVFGKIGRMQIDADSAALYINSLRDHIKELEAIISRLKAEIDALKKANDSAKADPPKR